ncbi:IS1595 family transposase [Sphingobium rhizovicinum]|uniref:IS1595 family transposase n=1 Tax=Sphingobium rhizovicinum TaxID=432308 RepID=A0ABV7NAS4_9SPHN
MASALSAKHFHDEQAAYDYVEARIWRYGKACPHCGGTDRISKMQGKSTRIGTYKCYDCRKPFTVKIGTIFESSHVPMNVWLQAIYLIAGSKKGISSNQLHRILGVTLKTAWFMSHRIREAMKSDNDRLMGGFAGTIEADETYIGNKEGAEPRRGFGHKMKVFALVERRTGISRAFVVKNVTVNEIVPIIERNVSTESRLMTDEASHYHGIGKRFITHDVVNHGRGEYVRVDRHTNTIEGYFSIFKRGMRGIYQHCREKHLHRYLAEFDFRYSNRIANGVDDATRAELALLGVVGKRLTYQTTSARA